jgi:hypothetical protein
MVNFKVSKADRQLIDLILLRAVNVITVEDRVSLSMDITACHANGTPLRLQEWLVADDFNFAHDVVGITRHIDRSTGKMMDCFSPRFSAH